MVAAELQSASNGPTTLFFSLIWDANRHRRTQSNASTTMEITNLAIANGQLQKNKEQISANSTLLVGPNNMSWMPWRRARAHGYSRQGRVAVMTTSSSA